MSHLFSALADAIAQQSKESLTTNRGRSLLSYCASPFATMCMLTAMILNRIVIFASSRRIKTLPRISRVLLRLVAIYALIQGSYGLFVSMKMYSSSSFIPSYFDFDRNTFKTKQFLGLYYSSTYFERHSTVNGAQYLFEGPSTVVFRPFYLSLCLSQILETFIGVTSGNKPCMETSLTLFEYSLAFQEAQGYNLRPSVELLVVALIALANQLSLHILDLFDSLKYRLIPSTVIGLYTLAFCFHLVIQGRIFYVPFSIMMGYLPHMISFAIICLSGFVYLLAGIVRGSFKDLTITMVFDNLSSINVTLSDDFYTALLTVGSFVVNASGKQSYVLEAPSVKLPRENYLEMRERLPICGYGINVSTYPGMIQGTYDIDSENGKAWVVTRRLKGLKRLATEFIGAIRGNVLEKTPAGVGEVQPETTENSVETQITDLNALSNDEIEEKYLELLLKKQIGDTDTSPDYQPSDVVDVDIIDKDDIGEEEINTNALGELMNADEFQSIIKPSSAQQLLENRILAYHMENYDKPVTQLTRSYFANYYDEEMKLMDLIREKRLGKVVATNCSADGECDVGANANATDTDTDALGTCVICHENSRQIILWPCKCLAICESCRVSLFVRKFDKCVCCRSEVKSYSKIYVP
ncbi:hypothetical protein FOA43_004614 [Brettanomyces nanus]|uniref:Protein ASI1 n=1 Tax=Eeniella nana TaxID=13502 RepID=A0A875RY75_EENNA|nr:uncharacterized protein FOA43_004614 [Brettanomyces nanus]QPG77207.1 hypothetical protein FOA43_004614 [Brettanomyces nanus]